MGTGYTRQSLADIQDGLTVFAGPLNAELNAIQTAFSGTVGHAHDGTTGEGPKIDLNTSITGVLPVVNGGFGVIHKTDATTPPGSSNDDLQGYGPGSLWLDNTSFQAWVNVDNTTADAVWRRITPTIVGTTNQIVVVNGNSTSGNPTLSISDNFLPIGIGPLPWSGDSAPASWMLCYGQAVSRSTYSQLFTILGTKHGPGNGSTTFNLPDMRGRTLVGKDDMGGNSANRITLADADVIGGVFGAESVSLSQANVPAHTHNFSATTGSSGSHTHTFSDSGSTSSTGAHTHSVSGTAASNGAHTHSVSATGTAASNGAHIHTVPGYSPGTTFNLLMGVSNGVPTSPPVSSETNSAGAHTHTVSVSGSAASSGAHTHSVSGTAASAGNHSHTFSVSGTTSSSGAHTHTVSGTTSSVGSGTAHSNLQPSLVQNFIIKVL